MAAGSANRLNNKFADSRRLLPSDAADLNQSICIRCDNGLYRGKLNEQAIRQRLTNARQTLKHVQLPRSEAFRLPVMAFQDRWIRIQRLAREESQESTTTTPPDRVHAALEDATSPPTRQSRPLERVAGEHWASSEASDLRARRQADGDFEQELLLVETVDHL